MTPRQATFAVFAVNGAMIGTWVAHIPWLQERLDISKTTIGFALLCMAVGALIAMPLTGQVLAGRSSARRDARRHARLLPDAAAAAARAQPGRARRDPVRLRRGQRRMDVSMNAHGVAVERDLGRPIMSSLHGGWSVGGFLAAGLSALAGAAGRDPRVLALCVGVALWLAAWWITARLGEASTHSPARAAASRCPPAA